MKYVYSFIAALILCALSIQTNGQQNSGQCKYDHTTFCGIVVELTVPCNWLGDEELMIYIEEDADIYICG